MKLFRELLLSRVGQTAIILGGGPSCPDDYARVRGRDPKVVLSANFHGMKLERCDYIVSVDEENVPKWKAEHSDVPLVSYLAGSSYRIIEYPILGMTGCNAAWVAWNLGCAPILLCGMGCYTDGVYFHDPQGESTGTRIDLDAHLKFWTRLRAALPENAPVRVVSGPVERVFPRYDPDEDFSGYVPPERLSLISAHTGILVKVEQKCRVGCEKFEPSQIVELSKTDAERLLTLRRVSKYKRLSVNQ